MKSVCWPSRGKSCLPLLTVKHRLDFRGWLSLFEGPIVPSNGFFVLLGPTLTENQFGFRYMPCLTVCRRAIRFPSRRWGIGYIQIGLVFGLFSESLEISSTMEHWVKLSAQEGMDVKTTIGWLKLSALAESTFHVWRRTHQIQILLTYILHSGFRQCVIALWAVRLRELQLSFEHIGPHNINHSSGVRRQVEISLSPDDAS